MTEKITLLLIDREPLFIMDDGTIIDEDKIGYVAINYTGHTHDVIYEEITQEHLDFIIHNDIPLEIEMCDNFQIKDEEWEMYDMERTPKLHKGKIIIHYK